MASKPGQDLRGPVAPIVVRPARPGDEDWLAHAAAAMAEETEGVVLEAATVRRGVRALLSDAGKGRVFVAEVGGRAVGSLYVTFEWSDWHAAWYWWLQSVYVDPRHRGQGVYRALHEAVQAAARAAGDVRSVRLYVEQANGRAIATYARRGMAETPYRVMEWVVR